MNTWIRRLLPVLVIAAGVLVLMSLVKSRPAPVKSTDGPPPPVVQVRSLQAADHQVLVIGQGTVAPSQQAAITAEVAGRVEWVSEALVPGGVVQAGAPLFRLEPARFKVAVARSEAELARAKTELQLEQGRAAVAQREWALFNRDDAQAEDGDERGVLARREPQLAAAQANVAAAKANLDEARLNLRRTVLRAPFDGLVQSESVDLGQYISPGQAVGQLVGSKQFWVQVTVPVDRLAWFSLPDADGRNGATARVVQRGGQGEIVRSAKVVRLLGELDPQARMAQLLVAVDQPLQGEQPLLLGTFADVHIQGRVLQAATAIPREAVQSDDSVWLVDAQNKLIRHALSIAWRNSDMVFSRQALPDETRVVVSSVPRAVEGMVVKPAAGQGAAE